MRIAYIINSLEGGGACFPVPAITSVFRKAGHEVAVFALSRRDGLALPRLEEAGLKVEICPAGEKQQVQTLRWLNRALTAWKPDLLWTSLIRATLLGQILGTRHRWPVVSWQHNANPKPINRRLLLSMRRLSCFWVGDSQFVTDETHRILGIPRERLACWPIFYATPQAPQAQPWQKGEVIRIGSLGRLSREKGYGDLCAALALVQKARHNLPPYEITVRGEGNHRAFIEERCRAHGLDMIHFPGFVTDTRDFLASQHMYVQPSRWEGFCVAMHEAMQAGLPVLGTAVGEMRYSVREGETGWRAAPRDPQSLADVLIRALSQPERFHDMGQQARNYVCTQFSEENFTRAGMDILERVQAITGLHK